LHHQNILEDAFAWGMGAPARMRRPDLNEMYGTNTPKMNRNQIAKRSKWGNTLLPDGGDTNTANQEFVQYESGTRSAAYHSLLARILII
jgi:hypothetical protein